jgi:isopentenyldiphosphate isomerase
MRKTKKGVIQMTLKEMWKELTAPEEIDETKYLTQNQVMEKYSISSWKLTKLWANGAKQYKFRNRKQVYYKKEEIELHLLRYKN